MRGVREVRDRPGKALLLREQNMRLEKREKDGHRREQHQTCPKTLVPDSRPLARASPACLLAAITNIRLCIQTTTACDWWCLHSFLSVISEETHQALLSAEKGSSISDCIEQVIYSPDSFSTTLAIQYGAGPLYQAQRIA